MSLLTLRGPRARDVFRPRPFLTAVSIVMFLVVVSFLRTTIVGAPSSGSLIRRSSDDDTHRCHDVHQAADVCSFVRANCEHEQPSLIPYLNIYYCAFKSARVAGFVLLVLWLGLLFSTIGIAASDFFTPNLQTIACVLSMPENLTGVTFLALGNGSPDLFSTIMSMRSNSAALAVGELIGAASFITAIVAGSIAMIKDFKVEKHSFARDIVFFIIAVTFTLGFLLDGVLRVSECIFMISYYACYVLIVSGSHFYITNRDRRVARAEERARAVEESLRQSGQERYRDQDENGTVQIPGQGASTPSIIGVTPSRGPSADSMPRIEIEGTRADGEPESEREHSKHLGAEIANSMRVRRSIGGRRNTRNLIRPSLAGALELNSALERFRREAYGETHTPGRARRHSMQNVPQVAQSRSESAGRAIAVDGMSLTGRDRAASLMGNVTAPTGRPGAVPPGHPTTANAEGSASPERSTPRHPDPSFSGRSFQLDGNLAVPPSDQAIPRPDKPSKRASSGQHSLAPGTIEMPSRRSTFSDQSGTLSPFPGLSESPLLMTPTSEIGQTSPPQLPLLSAAANIINNNVNNCYANEIDGDGDFQWQGTLRWWPYSILPPPEAIASTLFPTLQNWSEKSTMDAFVSLLSVPTVFLLSITLPVVDTRGPDPDEESECTRLNAGIEASRRLADTEWEEFRRHRRTHSRDSSESGSATPLSPLSPGDVPLRSTRPGPKAIRGPDGQAADGEAEARGASSTSDELMGWNKWQVLLQVIAGPPFAVMIITSLLLEQPQDVTMAAMKWSTVASGILFFIILLTTKQDVRPRFHSLLCFPGFLVSVAWIAAIAGEVVGALKAIGVIWSISEAVLGLTIFAAGNSVGDWVSNYTIARLGSPVMAL